MSKAGERDYVKKMSEASLRHAQGKPFTDAECERYLAEIAAVMALLPPPPARVLDLGCGMGWTTRFLALRGYTVHGCDISEDMIRHAAELTPPSDHPPTYSVVDFEALPFRGEFDAVLSFDCLHHALSPQKVVDGMAASLVAGGVAVVSEPGAGHAKDPRAVQAARTYDVTENDMPPSLVRRLGRSAGFATFRFHPHASAVQSVLYRQRRGPGLKGSLLSSGLGQLAGLAYLRLVRARRDGIVRMGR